MDQLERESESTTDVLDGATAVAASVSNEDVESAKISSALLDGLGTSLGVGLQSNKGWMEHPSASTAGAKIASWTHDIEPVGSSCDVVFLGQFFSLLIITRVAVV